MQASFLCFRLVELGMKSRSQLTILKLSKLGKMCTKTNQVEQDLAVSSICLSMSLKYSVLNLRRLKYQLDRVRQLR